VKTGEYFKKYPPHTLSSAIAFTYSMTNELILTQDFLWENMVENEQKIKIIFEILSRKKINQKRNKTTSCLLVSIT
jgi:hypothetical protein